MIVLYFNYMMSYLRDGKVHLPLTVSKKALLKELVYYRIEGMDEKATGDEKVQCVLAANEFHVAREVQMDGEDGKGAYVAVRLIDLHTFKMSHERYISML